MESNKQKKEKLRTESFKVTFKNRGAEPTEAGVLRCLTIEDKAFSNFQNDEFITVEKIEIN